MIPSLSSGIMAKGRGAQTPTALLTTTRECLAMANPNLFQRYVESKRGKRYAQQFTTGYDLTGRKFGSLTVRGFAGRKNTHLWWDCDCSCGNSRRVRSTFLTGGYTTHCGVLEKHSPSYDVDQIKLRFETHYQRSSDDDCWIWRGPVHLGYGLFKVKGKNVRAHRFAYENFNGPIPKGLLIRHKCDVRSCVNPRHLEVGSHQDNMNDCCERKRIDSVLSLEEVTAIRTALTENPYYGINKDLAEKYGVSPQTICDIKNGRSWNLFPWPNKEAKK